jgi:gliding motility-associated lipoprotein GldD
MLKSNLLRIPKKVETIPQDSDGQEMLEDLLHFFHKTAHEIMIPRLDMTAIDMKSEFKEILDLINKTGLSRIPVYEETEDNIKGILYVKDLLQAIENPESFQWKNQIRPPYFVPETKKIDDLLEEFRTNKIHIAIVVDEFGCTSGLVTLEDIIEEIVGEITDEYDREEKHSIRLPDGSYIFEGKIQLNDFFRETDIDEAEFGKITEEADTLAGLLLQIKGTLPQRRDIIDYKQFRFHVLEADERRVLKVKFSNITEQPATNKTVLPVVIGLVLLFAGAVSCTNIVSTPKPRGFYRIELPIPQYMDFSLNDLPFSFNVSQLVTVELPPVETSANWINLAYPALNVKIYCSYQTITPFDLSLLEDECRDLVTRNAKNANAITEHTYENPDFKVFGMLFRIDGETASPFQFMLTDSATHFFRGALYYECQFNIDSVAPVTQYLNENVIELIQSFHWK